jgi:hypothetical protein
MAKNAKTSEKIVNGVVPHPTPYPVSDSQMFSSLLIVPYFAILPNGRVDEEENM